MIFHSPANKTHFYKKGCALGLILKVRVQFWNLQGPIKAPGGLYLEIALGLKYRIEQSKNVTVTHNFLFAKKLVVPINCSQKV